MLTLALAVCAAPAFAADICPPPYDYCSLWKGACASGRQQSPIVTYAEYRVEDDDLPEPEFHYGAASRVSVKNTGTSLKVTTAKTLGLQYGAEAAKLVEFHFHVGAEHKPDVWNDPATGIAAGELHFVHETDDGKLIVVAVPIRVGATNAFLQALAALAPIAPCASKDSGRELPLEALLPADTGRYMTYTGSLTTPPCDEGVTWILMNSGITATREEIDALKVVCGNARPVQVNKNVVKARSRD
jgi:carbonic anhydrase